MNSHHNIYVIRSAASIATKPGAAGENLRSVTDEGEAQTRRLGENLLNIVGGSISQVRSAPAKRTRETALVAIGLTYSSVEVRREDGLTSTHPQFLKKYLEDISSGPAILFTHLDVIQSMVESVGLQRPGDETVPPASLTKFRHTQSGLIVDYIGKSVEWATNDAI